MHDPVERAEVLAGLAQRRPQLIRDAGIRAEQQHLGPGRLQCGDVAQAARRLLGAGVVEVGPGDQGEPAHAEPDEVPGQRQAQAAGAAGDQVSPGGIPAAAGRERKVGVALEPAVPAAPADQRRLSGRVGFRPRPALQLLGQPAGGRGRVGHRRQVDAAPGQTGVLAAGPAAEPMHERPSRRGQVAAGDLGRSGADGQHVYAAIGGQRAQCLDGQQCAVEAVPDRVAQLRIAGEHPASRYQAPQVHHPHRPGRAGERGGNLAVLLRCGRVDHQPPALAPWRRSRYHLDDPGAGRRCQVGQRGTDPAAVGEDHDRADRARRANRRQGEVALPGRGVRAPGCWRLRLGRRGVRAPGGRRLRLGRRPDRDRAGGVAVGPVAGPLERVRRQGGQPGAPGSERRPVQADAQLPQPTTRLQQADVLLRPVRRRPQRGQRAEHGGPLVAGQVLPHEPAERLPGAQFDVGIDPGGHAVPDRRREQHRQAQMLGPVARICCLLVGQRLAGGVRHDRDGRSLPGYRGHQGGQRVPGRPQQGGMERVRGAQHAGCDAGLDEMPSDYVDVVGRARQDGHPRAVQRGQVDLGRAVGERAGELPGVGGDGEHPAGRCGLDQPGPLGHQPQRVWQREHAGQARRDVLAEAVADQQIAGDAAVGEQPGQRVLDSEQQRVGDLGVLERVVGRRHGGPAQERGRVVARGGRFGAEHRPQVHPAPPLGDRQALLDRRREHRLGTVERLAQAAVLVADAGQQEGQPGPGGRPPHPRVPGSRGQPGRGLGCTGGDHSPAVVVFGPTGLQRVRDVGERGSVGTGRQLGQVCGQGGAAGRRYR